jgi:hypothetical protein
MEHGTTGYASGRERRPSMATIADDPRPLWKRVLGAIGWGIVMALAALAATAITQALCDDGVCY